jgi:hypothetical protein
MSSFALARHASAFASGFSIRMVSLGSVENVTDGIVAEALIEALRRYRREQRRPVQAFLDGRRLNGMHEKRAVTELAPSGLTRTGLAGCPSSAPSGGVAQ